MTDLSKIFHDYELGQSNLKSMAEVLRKELKQQEQQKTNAKAFVAAVKKYTDMQELDAAVLREFIDRIEVSHPGAVQSSIRVGRVLFGRNHPDYVGMQVVAMVLGGYFGSRLMQNLREEHGYTYGVLAAMVNLEQAGYLAVATQVACDTTRQALDEIYREIERLRTEPVPEQELEIVRNMMTGEMMRILDGPFGIADVTIENILCGQPNATVGKTLRSIRSITPDDIRRLAAKYLRQEDLVTVIAGEVNPVTDR